MRALILPLALLSMTGCKSRTDGFALKEGEAGGDQAAMPFEPEDLAVLFPVDRTLLGKAYDSHEAYLSDLDPHLLPLSVVMSKSFYEQSLLSRVTEETNERNLLSEDPAKAAVLSIPFEQWRIAAARFIPCALPRYAAPSSWLHDVSPSICRPRVRLSVQRFGATSCPTCGKRGTSDDKALHLVFDYVGNVAPEKLQRLQDVETKAKAAVAKLLGEGKLTNAAAVSSVIDAYVQGDANPILEELRKSFVTELIKLRDAGASGNLSLEYRAKKALPRFKSYIKDRLGSEAVPILITQNFVPTSTPGFTKNWIFAQYEPQTTKGSLQVEPPSPLARSSLDFVFPGADGNAKSTSAGELERFIDLPGRPSALDSDLRLSMLTLPPADVPLALDEAGLQLYTRLPIGEGDDREFEAHELIEGNEFKAALQKGYDAANDPRSHEVSGPSCLGCHVVSAVRAQYELTPVANGIVKDEAIGVKAYDLDAVGPGTKLQQVTFNKTWILRAFGYFGQLPVVSDRVVAEVNEDVRVVNAWRTSWAQ